MARFGTARAHKDLPPLPPKVDLESRAVLKACIGARAAVAEPNQEGSLLPNQDVLVNAITLLEARASSEIENVVTTADRLFRYAQPDREALADPAAKEALRYRTALRRASAGVLEEVKAGREKLFINPRLMRLLTVEDPGDLSFPAPARARRRQGSAR